MYTIDFHKPEHVHFIGIGGISMSGLAEILHEEGFEVSGSDRSPSPITDRLVSRGIPVAFPQKAENITDGISLVVYTAAIHEDNPELSEVRRRGLPVLTRAQLLGQIMKNYGTAVAVAGTHGKTTTTGMTAHVLMEGGLDPTVSIGGMLPSIGGNIRLGASDTFVTEACEYTNSFLEFFPTIAMILNVDADHLDFFKDLDEIADSFHRFAQLVPDGGTVIVCRDTARYEDVVTGLTSRVVTYGEHPDADYRAGDVSYDEMGRGSYTLLEKGTPLVRVSLSIPGTHNVLNSLAAFAAGRVCGLEPDVIAAGLAAFKGTGRRFEYKGRLGDITIIDDYAHHPTEIRATLRTARRIPHGELYVAFQPHTYTRTKALLPEFADALAEADHVLLADIYAAREKNEVGISSADLADAVNAAGGNALYLPSFGQIEDHLLTHCTGNDLILTVGAGNIHEVGEDLLGL